MQVVSSYSFFRNIVQIQILIYIYIYEHTHIHNILMSTSEKLNRFNFEIHEVGHQDSYAYFLSERSKVCLIVALIHTVYIATFG
jgi:hypothetical protein